jgi:hypothetical protein
MNPHQHPYHPIIYVRGFAATQGEIEETVADPYMGFNIGSTKSRMAWTGDVKRFYFESPLVRLMSDHGYNDVFLDGEDLVATGRPDALVPYRSVIIYRYYDEASKDFGKGETPPIAHFAKGLGELILRLRDKLCANKANAVAPADFRVHLVAHSMGGLVCRAFLQNPELGSAEARGAVDKFSPRDAAQHRHAHRAQRAGLALLRRRQQLQPRRWPATGAQGRRRLDRELPARAPLQPIGATQRDYTTLGGLVVGRRRGKRRPRASRTRPHTDRGRWGCEVAARLCQPQPLRPLRHCELRGGLPEPHALPVRRAARGRRP